MHCKNQVLSVVLQVLVNSEFLNINGHRLLLVKVRLPFHSCFRSFFSFSVFVPSLPAFKFLRHLRSFVLRSSDSHRRRRCGRRRRCSYLHLFVSHAVL